jgi:hypothetical protein
VDQLYFEEGYIAQGYHVYIAEALVGFGPYIAEGYLPTDFFEDRGSFAALSCVAQIVVGQEVLANGSWSSSFSLTAGISKLVSVSVDLNSNFSQTTIATRNSDIDLFAFSDAAISIQVQRIRDNNITASSAFTIAIDGARVRYIDSAEESAFSFDVVNQRSRATSLDAQAAFSLAAVIDATTDEVSANLVSAFSVNAIIGVRKQFNSSINAYSSILVSRRVGQIRPRNLNVGTINANNFFDSNIKRFGTHSYKPRQGSLTFSSGNTFINPIKISAGQSFIAEGWVYYDNSTSAYLSFNIGPVSILLSPNDRTQGSVTNSFGATTFSFDAVGISPSRNSWQYWAIVSDGSRISWYLNANRVATTTTLPTNYRVYSLDIYNNSSGAWTDELSFHKNTTLGFNPNNSTITIPTSARTNDLSTTEALWHFDGNGLDDFPSDTSQTGSAELISTFVINAKLTGPEKFSANLQSNSNLTCAISHIEGADLTAFGEASLNAQILRIQDSPATIELQFSLNCQDSKVTDVESNQSCNSSVNADISAIRDAQIATEAVGTQLIAAVRLAGLFVDDLVTTTLSADAVVTRSAVSSLLSSATVVADNFRIRFNSIDTASEFVSEVQGFVGVVGGSDMSAVFAQTADANRFRDNTVTLNAACQLSATGNNLGKIEGSLFDAVTMTTAAVKITSAVSTANTTAAVTANTDISLTKTYQSALSSSFTDSFTAEKRVGTFVFLTAFASKLTVAVKQSVTDLDVEVISTMSVSATKTTSVNANFANTTTQSTLAVKTARAISSQSSNFAQTTSAIKAVFGSASLSVLAFNLTAAVKTAGISISTNTTATMSVSAVKIARANSSLNSTANVAASILRIRPGQSALSSNFAQISTVGYLASAQITIASAMTFVSEVREIHIEEIVYVIPGEIWEYEISSETRLHTIGSESREYIIT